MIIRKLTHIVLFAFLAGLALFFQACQPNDNSVTRIENDLIRKIDQYLDLEEQNGFSGIISVQLKDEPLYSRCFGYANKEEGLPISQKTVFDIGSLTKQFTGAAILKLEMAGKLKVEDTLARFFPDIPSDKASISIHQLLTHTSGLPRALGYDYKRSNKTEFLGNIFSSKLVSKPGEEYHYSHAGYSLLGVIIESASGQSYEEYLRQNIFLPAGMQNTGYVLPLWEEGQVAHGYRRCRDWGKPMDMPWDSDGPYWNLKGNGGLISSSLDLLAWIDAIEGDEILSEEARNKFLYPQVREGDRAGSFYGYGWVIVKSSRGTDVIAHNADNRRFYTEVLHYRTEGVTILLNSNNDKPGNEGIPFELAKIIFWPEHEANVQGSVQECMDSLPSNRIGEVAGKFLALMESKGEITDPGILDGLFSDYLRKKHSPEHILNVLNDLKKHFSETKINKVVITDYVGMDINLTCNLAEGRKRLYIKLLFDEEDHLLIRMVSYDTYSR